MKKIKIATYCTWTSIGSILQAFGLKRALSEVGFESTIWLDRKDNEFVNIKIRSIKSFVKRVFEMLIHDKHKVAFRKRTNFISEHLDIEHFSTYNELLQLSENDTSDIVLAGSDQIWNPVNCNPVFFLDFVRNKKRVSYAASMGKTEIPEEKQAIFEKYIKNFDYISVRERACVEVIGSYTDKEIMVHIDPTFLVTANDWRLYEKEYNVHGPYILLYMLYWDKSCKEKIKKLKKATGLPVYAISNGLSSVYADKILYDVGVEEFLWLIDHAEYVVTSSFHGVAFSVIFNKKFAAVINPAMPSRIENLLKVLAVPLFDIEELTYAICDYGEINSCILTERKKSIEYLKGLYVE